MRDAQASVGFDVVVVTAQRVQSSLAYRDELLRWQREGRIDSRSAILAAPHPSANGSAPVGTGGEFLNALICASERLTALGLGIADASVLIIPVDNCSDAEIVASIGILPFLACGDEHLFCADIMTNLISSLFTERPPRGVVLCRGGITIQNAGEPQRLSASCMRNAATLIAAPLSPSASPTCYFAEGSVDKQNYGNPEKISMNDSTKRSVDPLAVHLSATLAAKLLDPVAATLQRSTFYGLDAGTQPLAWDFWNVFLPALARGSLEASTDLPEDARQLLATMATDCGGLWAVTLPDARAHNTRNIGEYIAANAAYGDGSNLVNCSVDGEVSIGVGSLAVNCECEGGMVVGSESLVLAVRAQQQVEVGDGCQLLQLPLEARGAPSEHFALLLLSTADDLSLHYTDAKASLLNLPLAALETIVPLEQLWPASLPDSDRRLSTAQLFPLLPASASPLDQHALRSVTWMAAASPSHSTPGYQHWLASPRTSLAALLSRCDASWQVSHALSLKRDRQIRRAVSLLSSRSNDSLSPILRSLCHSKPAARSLTSALLQLASSSSPDIASRVLSNLADLFSLAAGGGPRSGPCRHLAWSTALALLRAGRQPEGIAAVDKVLAEWVWDCGWEQGGGPPSTMLLRAARHLEASSRLLTAQAIKTVVSFIDYKTGSPAPPVGEWVTVSAPARIDLAGGWLDTPPVCYEAGGMVVNAAVLVDGKRPIGARVRRIQDAQVLLKVEGGDVVQCAALDDMRDFDNPAAPAALLKAAFLALKIVDLGPDAPPLPQQLERYAGGFEVETWSDLPQGSGMGTSSILGGAMIAALSKAAGLQLSAESVVHVVLYLEQLMTTGGGWQDQCGGIFPGVKACSSPAGLPLHVTTEILPLSDQALRLLSSHMVLIYTGKARLAATLLHDVLRRWHGRIADVVDNIARLRATAEGMRQAMAAQDIPSVGRHLSDYWAQKKVMAPDAEPAEVTRIMSAVQELCYGMSLAGAGGGGYMCLITKEPAAVEQVAEVVAALGVDASVHKVSIDSEQVLGC